MSGIVTELDGSQAARWFSQTYGDGMLAPERFEARVGMTICVPVLAKLLGG